MTFHEACTEIITAYHGGKTKALNYATSYATAGLYIDDVEGQRVQALYILNNITYWRGPKAAEVRKALKEVAK